MHNKRYDIHERYKKHVTCAHKNIHEVVSHELKKTHSRGIKPTIFICIVHTVIAYYVYPDSNIVLAVKTCTHFVFSNV